LKKERKDRSKWASARLKLLAQFCEEENKLNSTLQTKKKTTFVSSANGNFDDEDDEEEEEEDDEEGTDFADFSEASSFALSSPFCSPSSKSPTHASLQRLSTPYSST
jgi:hypothetical protein